MRCLLLRMHFLRCNKTLTIGRIFHIVKGNEETIPVTDSGGPWDVRRRGFYIFQTIGSQMTVRMSALRAGRPLPPGRFLVLISVRG
jgi:hypothetical protein